MPDKSTPYPRNIVVIGGGISGLMSSYHILTRMPNVKLILLEKGDYIPYQYSSSSRSAACSRQQFGCRHNIEMSVYSTKFYEKFRETFGEEMIMFHQKGYLFLYHDEAKWEQALKAVEIQKEAGLKEVRALTPEETLKQFPYILNGSLAGATFCPTDGFLDPGIILTALREKIVDLGGEIRTRTEVLDFDAGFGKVRSAITKDGPIPCDFVVNCTGAWSSRVGAKLGSIIPVNPEKRYLYTAVIPKPEHDPPDEVFQKVPMIVCMGDDLKPYIKPEPGKSPHTFTIGCEHPTKPEHEFRDEQQLDVEEGFEANLPGGYHEKVWQELVNWVSFAENFGFFNKVNGGFYETTADHNPFIDFDVHCSNLIHSVGFSGHGLMHGPACGQTVADLIEYGEYRTFPSGKINLTFMGYSKGLREKEAMKI